MGSNTCYVKVLWIKKTTTASFRYFDYNLSFWYQEGRKYGIELLKEEGYKGSKLIIRGTNNSDTGGLFSLFKTPCMESIFLSSGYYLCTETASQPPQKQWHYLRVKGPTNSLQNPFPSEPGEFVIYGILDPREQMNKSVSISTEGVTHRITCSFTDRDAKVGLSNVSSSHLWRENFSQIRWTRGNERKTFSDNPDLRIHSRKVKVFNFATVAVSFRSWGYS